MNRETLFAAAIIDNVLPEVRDLYGADWTYWRGVCDAMAASLGRKATYNLTELIEALIMGMSTQAQCGSTEFQLVLHSIIVADMQSKYYARKGNFIPSSDEDARGDYVFQVVLTIEAIRGRLRKAPGVDVPVMDSICTEAVSRLMNRASPLVCCPGPVCGAVVPMLVWPPGTTFGERSPTQIWS